MSKPYRIVVGSQKGGVGKTTVAVNLGIALSISNYKTLLVDADSSNPSVGFHLGLDQVNIGYRDVLTGKAKLRNATTVHEPSGLQVLPGTIGSKSFLPTPEQAKRISEQFMEQNYEFVIVDTAPGFFVEESEKYFEEALLVTNPEMSACASCVRLSHTYDENHLRHNLVINKVRNRRYELSMDEIEEMYGKKSLGSLPEDDAVPLSVSAHIPVYLLRQSSPFSKGIKELSRNYAARTSTEFASRFNRGGIFAFLRRLFHL